MLFPDSKPRPCASLELELPWMTTPPFPPFTPVQPKHQGRLQQPLGQSVSNIARLNLPAPPIAVPSLSDSAVLLGPET